MKTVLRQNAKINSVLSIFLWMLFATVPSVQAQQSDKSSSMAERQYQLDLRRVEAEEHRVETEKRHVEIEEKRAKDENTRAEGSAALQRWTAIGTSVPLFAVLATIAFSVWNTQRANRATYELKLLEVALDGTNSMGAYNRIRLAGDLFCKRVPGNLGEIRKRIENDYYGAVGRLPPETLSTRAAIMILLVEHPEMRGQILTDCAALYPREKWADHIRDGNSKISGEHAS